jgi:hypothetical protein
MSKTKGKASFSPTYWFGFYKCPCLQKKDECLSNWSKIPLTHKDVVFPLLTHAYLLIPFCGTHHQYLNIYIPYSSPMLKTYYDLPLTDKKMRLFVTEAAECS